MVDVVISIAAKVAELLVVPMGKHICYPFKYKGNMEKLKKQVEKLTNTREMVQNSVEEARAQGDEIERFFEQWLSDVDDFSEGVVKPIIDDEDKAGKLCSIGFFPNLMMHYSLSKKAAKTAKVCIDLLGEVKFQKVAYRPLLQKTISICTKDYVDFDSRKPIFDDLMQALKEADVNFIGVYGMGGVGKTTLVNKVVRKAVEDKLFDVVVMVDVTEIPEIKNIQGQIADKLGLKFQEESLNGRAARLRLRLEKEKRVLVVLDNIWAKLDLYSVGIPLGGEEKRSALQEEDQKGRNNEQRLFKILLTSRNLDVLRDYMNTQKEFFVNILCEEEAGNLFWKIVADPAKQLDFNHIAIEIIPCCAGLPVAIATTANALKNKSLSDWKDALNQLKRSNPRHISGMDITVYPAIELSYNLLEREEAKSLFLLCGLLPASYGVSSDYLLRYGMGLGLFENVTTLEEGRNRVQMLINYLKARCLLLDDFEKRFVKMHDIVHAVAVSIASTNKLMFNIQNVTNPKEMLEERLPKDAIAISLPYKDISLLPERLECPKLNLLFLFMTDLSLQIPDAFFDGMKELKVLDLGNIHLLSLPSSLHGLTKLQTLCMDECLLGDIAIIGDLKKLEVLSFSRSDLEQLPAEIGQLTQLKLLDLDDCSKLKVITPNVISSLTGLEELYMGNSFIQWEVEGQNNASISELKQLSRLTTLEIHVHDAQIVPQDLLIFEKLERYKILIGDVWEWTDDYEASRTLKLKLNDNIHLGKGIKTLLNRTEDLYLDTLKGVNNILYQLNREGFQQLKNLHVQNGPEIQYIVNSTGWGLRNVFPKLESLFLHKLVNLEKIHLGRLAIEPFNKLRIMKVKRCDGLKYLLSFSMAKNLMQLQEIKVTDCKMLEEIVFKESQEQVHQNDRISRVQFTQLRTLTIQHLPRLTSFGFNLFRPSTGSQEIIVEDDPSGFTSLFSQNVVLPSLENLKLSSINIGCTWFDQLPVMSSCCQSLTNLTLESCQGLKFLFSFSMVKSLVQLQKLEIRNSSTIEGIINTEALREEEKMIKMVFPKLLTLHLEHLPKLAGFSSGNSVEFPSLTRLYVQSCPKLKTFLPDSMSAADIRLSKDAGEMSYRADMHPLFDKKVAFPCLKQLSLVGLPELLHLWKEDSQPSTVFENLTSLDVKGCKNLKTLVPFSVALEKLKTLTVWNCNGLTNLMTLSTAKTLVQLKAISIGCCEMLEEIIIDMRDEEIMTAEGEKDAAIDKITFSMLNSFELWCLPNLTSFYSGSNTLECPSLTTINITICPKMEKFVFPNTKDLSIRSVSLFNEKVTLPVLASLELSGIGIQTIWHKQLLAMSFMAESLAQLKVLKISNCEFIKGVIVTEELISATPFPKLNQLKLKDLPELTRFCNFSGNSIELPSLSKLWIENCPKMDTFVSNLLCADITASKKHEELNLKENLHWDMRPFIDEKAMSFCLQQLTELTFDGCDNLKYLFPSSMAESLVHLEILKISNCKFMEGVIISQEERKSSSLLPKLNQLKLKDLPELTRFCNFSGCLIELPSLSELEISKCPKMQTFASDSVCADMLAIEEPKEANTEENIHSFFDEKVAFPCLNRLVLCKLPEPLHLRKENSQPSKVFENLAHLEVSGCGNLVTLVPSSVSLQKLETLEIQKCDGLINLMTFSTAKSLEQLKIMKIIDCKTIEEIIVDVGDEINDVIVFNQLKYLKLCCLPSLTNFCRGNFTIEVPYLQRVLVIECLKMMTFSQGVLSMPKLQRIHLKEQEAEVMWEVLVGLNGFKDIEDGGCWEGDLNTTIQKLFKDVNAESSEKIEG
ncbi:hypothetical protein ACOSQ3_030479 [Xanthoceras sorbifolium]